MFKKQKGKTYIKTFVLESSVTKKQAKCHIVVLSAKRPRLKLGSSCSQLHIHKGLIRTRQALINLAHDNSKDWN